PGIVKRLRRHEWIVVRCDDEGGDANAIDDAHRARAVVVVLRPVEPEIGRRVRVVELADGANAIELGEVEAARPEAVLAPHASLQVPNEIPLIERIAPLLQRANALADFDDRRD